MEIDVTVYFVGGDGIEFRLNDGATVADLKQALVTDTESPLHAHVVTQFGIVAYSGALDYSNLQALPDTQALADDEEYFAAMQ